MFLVTSHVEKLQDLNFFIRWKVSFSARAVRAQRWSGFLQENGVGF